MNRKEYLTKLKEEFDFMQDLAEQKNAWYSSADDAYWNFKNYEALGVCSLETGILSRIVDKISRISNLIGSDKVLCNESVSDTLRDLAIYSMLLKIYIDDILDKKD